MISAIWTLAGLHSHERAMSGSLILPPEQHNSAHGFGLSTNDNILECCLSAADNKPSLGTGKRLQRSEMGIDKRLSAA